MSNFVIARAPFRISFFGGGTDYPAWYTENPGAVLATSIDKYCYLMCRWLPPFFEHKHHIAYSEIERPQDIDEIRHPAIRETLRFLNITKGVGIHHAGDLPARAGMGTSSAFTVALLHAFYTLKKVNPNKLALAFDAIHIEQNMIKENVGAQDQTMSAFGGFNRIEFRGVHDINVEAIKSDRLKELERCLMLFFTGFSRTASRIAKAQIERISDNKSILKRFYGMVDEGRDILLTDSNLVKFGELLAEGWSLKKRLHKNVSTEYIDFLYSNAISAGATGGKLLGAGSGGFLLLFVEPDAQKKVKEALDSLLNVPFKFESSGSRIIFK